MSNNDSNSALYEYVPSLAAGATFLALFSLLTAGHLGLVLISRRWWLLVTVVGGVTEVIGWAGRTMSSSNNAALNPFLMQQVCLVLAPCFYSAALYGELGMLIGAVGPQHSLLRPKLYLYVFCFADLCAIIVQAVGGSKAASSIGVTENGAAVGANIMLGGIVLQLVSMIVFCILGINYWSKARKDSTLVIPEGSRIRFFAIGIVAASIWVLIRCVYRVVELSQGWSGYLMSHEPYFWGLDGIPMVFTMAILLVAHPYFCLPKNSTLATGTSPADSTDTLMREKNSNRV